MTLALGTSYFWVKLYVCICGVQELMSFGYVNFVVKLVFKTIWVLTGNDPFGVLVSLRKCSFCI